MISIITENDEQQEIVVVSAFSFKEEKYLMYYLASDVSTDKLKIFVDKIVEDNISITLKRINNDKIWDNILKLIIKGLNTDVEFFSLNELINEKFYAISENINSRTLKLTTNFVAELKETYDRDFFAELEEDYEKVINFDSFEEKISEKKETDFSNSNIETKVSDNMFDTLEKGLSSANDKILNLIEKHKDIQKKEKELKEFETSLNQFSDELNKKKTEINERNIELDRREKELNKIETKLNEDNDRLIKNLELFTKLTSDVTTTIE